MAVKVQGTTVITDSRQIRSNEITNEAGDGPTDFPSGLEGASLFFTATVTGSDGTSDWSQATSSDPFIATLTVSGTKSTDVPLVGIDLSNVTFADTTDVLSDFSKVYRIETSADDEIKLYSTEEPTKNLNLILKVVR